VKTVSDRVVRHSFA